MNNEQKKVAHILLVEDNEGDIYLTKEAFEEAEIKTDISVVQNGRDALDFVFQRGVFTDAKKPDVILLDINIPIFNGHEVLQQIKADVNLQNIPVIILSTSSHQRDIEKARAQHCDAYLNKPLEITEFRSAILKLEESGLERTTLLN